MSEVGRLHVRSPQRCAILLVLCLWFATYSRSEGVCLLAGAATEFGMEGGGRVFTKQNSDSRCRWVAWAEQVDPGGDAERHDLHPHRLRHPLLLHRGHLRQASHMTCDAYKRFVIYTLVIILRFVITINDHVIYQRILFPVLRPFNDPYTKWNVHNITSSLC